MLYRVLHPQIWPLCWVVRYPFFWAMPTQVKSRLSGVALLDKSPQRHGVKDSLWRVLITHKHERIFFCLVLALESQESLFHLSRSGFAQNEWLWLLHYLHSCHSIFNLSLEASSMQSCCRSSGPVQNVEWQWHFLRHSMDVSMTPTLVFPFFPGRQITVSRIDTWSPSQTPFLCLLDPAQQGLGDPKPTTSWCHWDSSPPLCFRWTALCVCSSWAMGVAMWEQPQWLCLGLLAAIHPCHDHRMGSAPVWNHCS